MRTVAAELRAAGEMPAPAHFGLLSMLSAQPRTLTELAALQGVSLPTMSNSISAMVERGWVRRTAPEGPARRDDRGDAHRPRRARARRTVRRGAPGRGARAARSAVAAPAAGRPRRAAEGVRDAAGSASRKNGSEHRATAGGRIYPRWKRGLTCRKPIAPGRLRNRRQEPSRADSGVFSRRGPRTPTSPPGRGGSARSPWCRR